MTWKQQNKNKTKKSQEKKMVEWKAKQIQIMHNMRTWVKNQQQTYLNNNIMQTFQIAWKVKYFFLEMSMPFIGEGNGTPLQYSCLENPMDREAW